VGRAGVTKVSAAVSQVLLSNYFRTERISETTTNDGINVMKTGIAKIYDEVDYDFRPKSFWVVADSLAAILRNVRERDVGR
jgi:hypothetical protein